MEYEIFKSIITNTYIALIYDDSPRIRDRINKEINNKGFIITDEDYEGKSIVLWLEKKKLENDK